MYELRARCWPRSPACTRVTLQPAAGAHGELTGLMMIRAYHRDRGERSAPRCSSPTRPTAPTRPPRRSAGYTVVRAAVRAARQRRPRTTLRGAGGRRRRRPHAHQPEHARPVRGATSREIADDRPRARAAWSTATAPTSTPSWASPGPATWASTSCTTTCTRPSRTPHGGGGPGSGPVGGAAPSGAVPAGPGRRASEDGDALPRSTYDRPKSIGRVQRVLRQLRHARARLHLHPHARAGRPARSVRASRC